MERPANYMPIVSIIMPCYNASSYLREAIESLQSQSYSDWELLIVDDGSTDRSQSIAQEYTAKDARVHLVVQPNSGACRARNNGIEQAKGKYIKFLDADDILEPKCLEMQVGQIEALSARQIPFGDYYNVDKDGHVLNQYVFNREDELKEDEVYFFFSDWHILITAPLHRTELLREIGGFNESLKRGQESDLHMRLALADVQFVYQPCMTFRYRDHNAASRISEKYQEGTKNRHLYWIQRAHICEDLFIKKYGTVPAKYFTYFADTWFDYARNLFAIGNRTDGIEYLKKARKYGLHTAFEYAYLYAGLVVGYTSIERLFQLRLKLLHKK